MCLMFVTNYVPIAEEFSVVQKEVSDLLQGRILVGHALRNDLKVYIFYSTWLFTCNFHKAQCDWMALKISTLLSSHQFISDCFIRECVCFSKEFFSVA